MNDSALTTRQPSRLQWAVLLAIFLLAIGLRFFRLGYSEAHFDELWHMEVSAGRGSLHELLPINQIVLDTPALTSLQNAPPWYRIPGSLNTLTHPPLFFLLLRFWRDLFGDSLTIARAFSAVFSSLCILAIFDAARQCFRPSVALWAALIAAVSATQIIEAQDVRHYPLLMFSCLIAAGGLLRIQSNGITRGNIAMLFFGSLGGIFTHYFSLPIFIAMAIYAIARFPKTKRNAVLMTIFLAYFIFAISWGWMLHRQSHAMTDAANLSGIGEARPDHVLLTFKRLANAPLRQLFEPLNVNTKTNLLSAMLLVIPWLLVRRDPNLLLWTLWMTLLFGFTAALDLIQHTRHLEVIRHTILAGPAEFILLAAMLASGPRWLAHLVPATIAIACAAGLGLIYNQRNLPYDRLAGFLRDTENTRGPIIIYSDRMVNWWSAIELLILSHYGDLQGRPTLRLNKPIDQQLLAELHRWPDSFAIIGPGGPPPENLLPGTTIVRSFGDPYIGVVQHFKWDSTSEPATAPTQP